MRKFLLATMFLATLVAAVPAFAAVQNIKVSGDIDSKYVYRDRFDLRGRDQGNNVQFEQDLFLTQTRLRVDAELTDNVSATVALINERVWGDEADANSTPQIDLNLAYVQLREMLYSPLTVQVGRQLFNYGNAFVIGAGGVNNTISAGGLNGVAEDLSKRTAYDGVKMVFDYNPLTIDLFAAKADANNSLGVGSQKDDVDLYGVNGNYHLGDEMDTTIEAYFFSKFDRSLNVSTTGSKADTVYTPGLRASTNPVKGLNLQAEAAWQRGNKVVVAGDSQQRDAFGAQVITNYQVPLEQTAKWNPVITGVYTYTSGDSNPGNVRAANQVSTNRWTAWDPMFEDQAGGTIYNSLFDLTNSHIASASAQVNPIEDVTAKVTWTGLWLDKEVKSSTFSMRQPDGVGISPKVTTNKDIGYEVDADLMYDYTEDVQLGLSLGWFVPGNFFDSANNENAKQAIAKVGVAF